MLDPTYIQFVAYGNMFYVTEPNIGQTSYRGDVEIIQIHLFVLFRELFGVAGIERDDFAVFSDVPTITQNL